MNIIQSCLPAIITILTAFYTQNVLRALSVGVIFAAGLITQASPLEMGKLLLAKFLKIFEVSKLTSLETLFDSERVMIFLFLIVLGAIIHLIMVSGSSNAYLRFSSKFINSRPKVEVSVLCLPFLLFIDDYLSAIMTSCVMPKLTDRFGVSRIKVSYLITAVAAPLCAIIPISSWAAATVIFIADAGVSNQPGSIIYADSFYTLLQAIPTMFYCILSIICAFFVAIFSIDLDCTKPLAKEEAKKQEAQESLKCQNKTICTDKTGCQFVCSIKSNATFLDFLFPIATISVAVVLAILHTGSIWQGHGIIKALAQANAPKGLFFGSLVAFLLSSTIYIGRNLITSNQFLESIWEGFCSMKGSMAILTMSAILSEFLKHELGTCEMISQRLVPLISQQFLPLSFFIICAMMAFSIGSSWATMSVIFPIAVSIVSQTKSPSILIVPVVGAILSGVIFGNSLSPMSDLIAMTSRNTKVNLLDYLKAQVLYLTPVGIGAGTSFFVFTRFLDSGYKVAVFAGLLVGLGVSIILLSTLKLLKNVIKR